MPHEYIQYRKDLAHSLSEVNKDTLALMSEIIWYPLSYDETQLKIHMVDRNVVYVPIYYVSSVNNYRHIVSTLSQGEVCVYFDSDKLHPYVGECLKDEEEVRGNEFVEGEEVLEGEA